MITFYPGPSKVYPQVAQYMQDAFAEGILSVNHRSPECMEITRGAIEGLHQKLNIPEAYFICFISSATEAWEIIAQSLTVKESVHIYNGAFGEKWADYAEKLIPKVERITFDIEELPDLKQINACGDVVCITQNETSNGTQIKDLKPFRNAFPEAIIAVDATSSLGGIALDWQQGDVWFASVQKCLGLPAGMAIMLCSPKAIQRAEQINDRKYYNSLLFIHDNFQKFQTHYTPNVLNIYLLNKIMADVPNISKISERIRNQADSWYKIFDENVTQTLGCNDKNEAVQTKVCATKPLIQNPEVRSDTVIAIAGNESQIKDIKTITKANGITVGNGYGSWKNTTFRIANFPTIEVNEIRALEEILIKL
ncbi:aminotransferase class V-fold PLP-dependent enzyme [Arcicella sp. LKC2W]|uniref:aminotransferase class V-fold PLP-dependent enzyme n=1 Tax=Arcicella sp. LKC2W TaxID=2984198 RepID=UPI002B2105BF|nr:aminotransferase class V-fold PLP-dependent enzyme [Arcicella sp. LKC2W]MEA5458753.1 aminotransferase class V-fold PLP-dependent enzyme [Arcicella sp. LKC2W]